MDGIHDMGGMHGFGPVDVTATAAFHEPWALRLQVVAFVSGAVTRAALEEIDPATYLSANYHERWLLAAETRGVQTGRVDPDALERWRRVFRDDPDAAPPRRDDPEGLAQVDATLGRPFVLPAAANPRFAAGDRVRVRRMRPEPHHRCPRYIRGAIGEVEKVVADDFVPGTRMSEDIVEAVYTIRFDSTELWGDRAADGEPPFDLFIDQWERYLEPADE